MLKTYALSHLAPAWGAPGRLWWPCCPELNAAQLAHRPTHQCLHDGVVGSIHVGVQREGTFPLTVVRGIAFGRDDPVLQGKRRALGSAAPRTTATRGHRGPACQQPGILQRRKWVAAFHGPKRMQNGGKAMAGLSWPRMDACMAFSEGGREREVAPTSPLLGDSTSAECLNKASTPGFPDLRGRLCHNGENYATVYTACSAWYAWAAPQSMLCLQGHVNTEIPF